MVDFLQLSIKLIQLITTQHFKMELLLLSRVRSRLMVAQELSFHRYSTWQLVVRMDTMSTTICSE